jgi:Protein of unknown function (DUF3592)
MQRRIDLLALAACFILAGALLDGGYQRSTPGSLQAQGTIVDFERGHSRQVYPVFEFKDADGMRHRVVNSTQQAIARFSRGDSVPIAYSRIDPERARIDTLWFNHLWVIGGMIVGLAIIVRALAGGDLTIRAATGIPRLNLKGESYGKPKNVGSHQTRWDLAYR